MEFPSNQSIKGASPTARITYLTAIEFGAGSLASLSAAPSELGMRRALLVADRGVMAAGLGDKALALLPACTPVFVDTPPNPTESAVRAARSRNTTRLHIRDERCRLQLRTAESRHGHASPAAAEEHGPCHGESRQP